MKLRLVFIFTILILVFCQALDAQKVILLQKPGTTKRFMFKTGDNITVMMGNPEFIAGGVITYIDDTLCIVNKNFTIPLSSVKEVKLTRHFLNSVWRMMFLIPVVYTGISIINRGIHDEKPLLDNTIPIVGGSFIALGSAAYLLRYRHCKIDHGWKLKVLDFDIYKDSYRPKE